MSRSDWLPARGTVLYGSATLALTLGGTFVLAEPAVGIVLMVAAGPLAYFGHRSREGESKKLGELESRAAVLTTDLAQEVERRKTRDAMARSACVSLLESVAVSAGLGAFDRLSAYVRVDEGWRRVARHCENIRYRESGREYLGSGAGVLARTYQQGAFSIQGLADFEEDPETYFAEHRQLGCSKAVVRSLEMKSRSYAGYALESPATRSRRLVVIFESLDPNGLDADQLDALVRGVFARTLHDCLTLAADH